MKDTYKVLLIEPHQEQADILIDWLDSQTQLTHVLDHENAKKQCDIEQWDLVIIDIHSPEVKDLAITKVLKDANSLASILIIAENIKVDFILAAMEYHANALLFKPIEKKEFITKVVQLCEESKERRKKSESKVILAIGAHPDDVEFGCGGTLAKLKEDGNQINILTLSLGSVGGDPKLRKQEAEQAAKIQGAQLFLGDLEDTRIDTANTITFIENIVKQVNPTHIYTHSNNDNHQDHKAIFNSTIVACRQISNIYSYLSPSSTVDFRPNIFINVDDYIDTKLQVLKIFQSQSNLRPYLQPDMIVATARYWGRFCNYHLAEPMEVIKEHS